MSFKKWTALLTVSAMLLGISGELQAQNNNSTGGNGYMQYRTAPSLTPSVALAGIGLVAIIAVALQNANDDHSH